LAQSTTRIQSSPSHATQERKRFFTPEKSIRSGTISYDEFCSAAKHLSENDPHWSIRQVSSSPILTPVPGQHSLVGREMLFPVPVKEESQSDLQSEEALLEERDDGSMGMMDDLSNPNQASPSLKCEMDNEDVLQSNLHDGRVEGKRSVIEYVTVRHEILYQTTYRVPTMIIQAYHPDGKPASMETLDFIFKQGWKTTSVSVPEAKCYLLPLEHPIEGTPTLTLKVCELSNLLRLALSGVAKSNVEETDEDPGVRYLLCWLGIVGPYVGLRINACHLSKLLNSNP